MVLIHHMKLHQLKYTSSAQHPFCQVYQNQTLHLFYILPKNRNLSHCSTKSFSIIITSSFLLSNPLNFHHMLYLCPKNFEKIKSKSFSPQFQFIIFLITYYYICHKQYALRSFIWIFNVNCQQLTQMRAQSRSLVNFNSNQKFYHFFTHHSFIFHYLFTSIIYNLNTSIRDAFSFQCLPN